ncbi:MAG: DUF1015 domain-containing protein [Phascolarctobacterium sp.]|nr:DUF1015 domain-containing protein [Phascolarctobacterium sp.]MBR2220439.1 DUF1015 domain-containing protein [Phascolarctobacterium sp.]
MKTFAPANILLPKNVSFEKWAVIACDQFTSQPEYWKRVRENVGEAVSTLNLVFPEAELNVDRAERIKSINENMAKYLVEDIFTEYKDAYVYVERTLKNGVVRKGIVGVIDLEQYDYNADSKSAIRATEQTVLERIPPRVEIRRNASMELPHVLLLCDDEKERIIEPLTAKKVELPKIYDFDLMEGGGHIEGYLLQDVEVEVINEAIAAYEADVLAKYEGSGKAPMTYAVGDGNHSLATAKACYEELKAKCGSENVVNHPARFALVELENIYDEAQVFEPIHRLLTNVNVKALLENLQVEIGGNGTAIKWFANGEAGELKINDENGELPLEVIQIALDKYLKANAGEIDYIHGDETLEQLSQKENTIGFLMPNVTKNAFFENIVNNGVMPRKTFSMGEAEEKRYYLEGRRIVE